MNELKQTLKRGVFQGVGIAIGLAGTVLLAATISGTINTFSSGEVLDAAKINANFSSLKTAVESIDPQFSTTETATHMKWTDGKTIYRKVVAVGTLPNNTTSSVAHSITGFDQFLRIYGHATDGTNPIALPHPGVGATAVRIQLNGTQIQIISTGDYSAYTGFVTLEYTKL